MGLTCRGWKKTASPPAGRRFLKDRRGATGVEFAMLAFPFALLTFTILESCIAFAAQEMLANATDKIAREMRTGQIKPGDVSEGKLKQMVCDRIKMLAPSSCLSDVEVDLRTYSTFTAAASAKVKIVSEKIEIERFDEELKKVVSGPPKVGTLGKSGTKNSLMVFYKWPVITNFVANNAGTTLQGKRTLHFSSATWQNEPFSD